MFLARQGMPLEKLWEAWFRGLEGLVPVEPAHKIVCQHNEHTAYTEDGMSAVEPCQHFDQGTLLQKQYLFSVYVHSSRLDGWTNFDPTSVFYGTLLPEKYEANWGDVTPAARGLLSAALLDPWNVNFVLLSDSDVPLYPATLVYNQLVQEKKSRFSACWPYDMVNIKRYSCAMEADGLGMDKWRKSSTWFTMIRSHAQLAAQEAFVYSIFRRHCTGVGFDEEVGDFRGCLTDEHYFGTMLAYYNRAPETDCLGVITVADFSKSEENPGHPRLYVPEDINVELMEELRRPIWWLPPASCAAHVTKASRNAFIELDKLKRGFPHDHCNKLHFRRLEHAMETQCNLFARKFAGTCALPLLSIFTNASNENLRFDVPGQIEAGVIGTGEFITRVQS